MIFPMIPLSVLTSSPKSCFQRAAMSIRMSRNLFRLNPSFVSPNSIITPPPARLPPRLLRRQRKRPLKLYSYDQNRCVDFQCGLFPALGTPHLLAQAEFPPHLVTFARKHGSLFPRRDLETTHLYLS